MFQNPPRDFKLCQFIFQIPDVFTELGVVLFICIIYTYIDIDRYIDR